MGFIRYALECTFTHLMNSNKTSPINATAVSHDPPMNSNNKIPKIITTQLKTCTTLKHLESIFSYMIKNNLHQNCFLLNQLISSCTTFHQTGLAEFAFSQSKQPNVFVYNAMIRGHVLWSSEIKALELYMEMLRVGVSVTTYTYSSLIKACTIGSARGFGEGVHCQISKSGFDSNFFVQTPLIEFYSSFDRIVDARKVFDEMSERDAFAWTSMVSGLVRVGDVFGARALFDEMPVRNIASWNSMLAGYARLGDVVSASALFDEMPERDSITWTSMITCYSQNKQFREAIEVFEDMRIAGVSCDAVTMASVISACAHIGALEIGRDMHVYAMRNGFKLDVFIGSALVDMYAKCGSIENSLVVFFKLQEKNLFCWNAIIEGLGMHGYGERALEMFKMMEVERVKPNGVTFVGVLTACTHAGLVEEGRRCFTSMIHHYSVAPGIEHYGCMVDLLGRAGMLEEALELIESMVVEPNAIIWGALLSGCKIHRNLEIAELALKKLMNSEPGNSGYYALLINTYAEANQWGEVARVRATMKEHGVEKKCPGSSLVEIAGMVHEFAASDNCHPMHSEIRALLIVLNEKLKLAKGSTELW
ncbi:hypothetical protein Scep_010221 [Stephania cephalantha]|uniref:Chlororespiratory reduction 4 n=1 Tax=Stephania cephalantha TaxID=152367 RepID=A0AAP0JVN1_9MAGN